MSSKGIDLSFGIELTDIPFNDFVELPENLNNLHYNNLICGVIKGALSIVIHIFIIIFQSYN